ncbi:hypothetical protein R6G78_07855, partial [Actinotignum timonense]|uniref:hypothetical protein n=1 Tax=Actinotignum timonense TaxID=1870995 RepID=UPI002A7F39A6
APFRLALFPADRAFTLAFPAPHSRGSPSLLLAPLAATPRRTTRGPLMRAALSARFFHGSTVPKRA